jgi:hypothetical protein
MLLAELTGGNRGRWGWDAAAAAGAHPPLRLLCLAWVQLSRRWMAPCTSWPPARC